MLKHTTLHAAALLVVAGIAQAAPPVVEAPRELNQEGKAPQNRVIIQGQAPGQTTTQPGVQIQVNADQRNATWLDHRVADCLLIKNTEEVNLAAFAKDRTQNQQVRDFAQKLVASHNEVIQKLQPFAGAEYTRTQAQSAVQPGQQQTAPIETATERAVARRELRQAGETPRQAREAVRDAVQAGAERIEYQSGYRGEAANVDNQLLQISREASKNCEQMMREQLSKEQGNRFDEAFLGCQIGSHIAMLAELKAVEPHVSGQLQQVVRDGIAMTQSHKDQAEQLMNQLSQNNK